MSNNFFAFAEMALVFGVIIGFCVWELRKLRQYKEADERDAAKQGVEVDPNRGLFGVKRTKQD
jgi:uncharacterized membrane-anchored protein YhcB (DUF1043 family)